MNAVRSFDPELGLITVEPGTTTGDIQTYLTEHNASFIAPTIAIGRDCSVIGNLLERGHSVGPYVDRSASLMGIEVVLGDGSMYRSAIQTEAMQASRSFFKWGVGPYIDGLFSQSNFGIVTSATVALAPKPVYAEVFIARIKNISTLVPAIDRVRQALQTLGSTLPTLRILNSRHMLARTMFYPGDSRTTLHCDHVAALLEKHGHTSWTILGSLQGEYGVVRAAKDSLRILLRPVTTELLFFDEHRLLGANRIFLRPFFPLKKIQIMLPMLRSFYASSTGITLRSRRHIPLWRVETPQNIVPGEMDYDLDTRCGLLFLSIVFPFRGPEVVAFVATAEARCIEYGVEPLISFFNFSDRCLGLNMPLLFDRQNEHATKNARDCRTALFALAERYGAFIQRRAIDTMDKHSADEFENVARTIKRTLDPDGIISPGRYI